MHEWYTVDEISKLLRISPRQVRILCERGEIKCIKLGRLWRIHVSTIEIKSKFKTDRVD